MLAATAQSSNNSRGYLGRQASAILLIGWFDNVANGLGECAEHLLHAGTDIRMQQELLGRSNVSATMTYTHVLKVPAGGTASPLDALQALVV